MKSNRYKQKIGKQRKRLFCTQHGQFFQRFIFGFFPVRVVRLDQYGVACVFVSFSFQFRFGGTNRPTITWHPRKRQCTKSVGACVCVSVSLCVHLSFRSYFRFSLSLSIRNVLVTEFRECCCFPFLRFSFHLVCCFVVLHCFLVSLLIGFSSTARMRAQRRIFAKWFWPYIYQSRQDRNMPVLCLHTIGIRCDAMQYKLARL